jgi:hypothetical protein
MAHTLQQAMMTNTRKRARPVSGEDEDDENDDDAVASTTAAAADQPRRHGNDYYDEADDDDDTTTRASIIIGRSNSSSSKAASLLAVEKEKEGGRALSLRPMFALMDASMAEELAARARGQQSGVRRTALSRHMTEQREQVGMNGLLRIQRCRAALDALDRRGWDRSFHQRLFHEEYLKSCARIFFKCDGPGAFARNHNRVLEMNGWDSTPQEILVSTPRRFGKTISVSMFAAAIIFAAPNIEMSIYSTCKRISQKLLRNIVKFMELIYLELKVPPYKVLRMNSEEIHISGPEGQGDVRIVNSYPSKIGACVCACA